MAPAFNDRSVHPCSSWRRHDESLTVTKQTEFHWLLGPSLMVAFAFLGNTLFLTILVSMLSNTFANIAVNTTAEVQFRRAVLTLEGVKSDAIFAYQPPFNILAIFVFIPLRFILSPRWFHKIHVYTVRLVNLPILLVIAVYERRLLWSDGSAPSSPQNGAKGLKGKDGRWFWEKWRITAHRDIRAVFEIELPESVEEEIAMDDTLTHNLIRRQFVRQPSSQNNNMAPGKSAESAPTKSPRRDSIFPGVAAKMRGSFSEGGEGDLGDVGVRLQALELAVGRIETLLLKVLGDEKWEAGIEWKGKDVDAAAGQKGEGQEEEAEAEDERRDADPRTVVSRAATGGSSTLRGSVEDIG
jgi:hypothetical protein